MTGSPKNNSHDTEPMGVIFDIQGYSVHDGPGCRTVVFLSGCPLRCLWCANPEGLALNPKLLFLQTQCRHDCRRCADACHHNAVAFTREGHPQFDRSRCDRCAAFECVAACFNGALRIAGKTILLPDLMKILNRDRNFWGEKGGVTFGGGEPLFQKDFVLAALKQCRDAYIHTALETSAHVEGGVFQEALRWTDWLFIDLKQMDEEAHRRATGIGNVLILRNLASIASLGWPGRAIVRIPIVPEFNDSSENIRKSAEFLHSVGLHEVQLLPFHRLGSSKYRQLGMAFDLDELKPPSDESMRVIAEIFISKGFSCYIDHEAPF